MTICTKIESVLCPICGRKLKPGVIYPKNSSITMKDVLVCRYCDLSILVADLRIFGKKVLEKKIRKRKKIKYITEKKYKHPYGPKKCPYCKSLHVSPGDDDYWWDCEDCGDGFYWKKYTVIFHGQVDVYDLNENNAIEKAYYYLEKQKVDIEAEIL